MYYFVGFCQINLEEKMKKIVSLMLMAVLVCTLLPFSAFAEYTEFLVQGSDWQYLEYENAGVEGPEGWETGKDSESWYEGTAPFGNTRNSNVITPMSWDNFSCYMRTTFTVDNKNETTVLLSSL